MENKRITACIVFYAKKYKIEFYKQIVQGFLEFGPETIEVTDIYSNRVRKFSIDVLKKINIDEQPSIEIYNGQRERLSFIYPAVRSSPLTVYYTLRDHKSLVRKVLEFAEMEDFMVAYVYDEEFVFWQSESDIGVFELNKISHENLPKMVDPIFEREVIDTRKNPGRRTLVPGLWLQSAWLMMFGRSFFKFVPKERLIGFPYADEIKELASGAISIRLFGNPKDSSDIVNLQKMEQFRDWIGLDDLEKKFI